MEKEFEITKEDYQKLLLEINTLSLKVRELEEELIKLRDGELGTGVYLEGCPDYAKDYIIATNKKEGGN